VAVRPQSCKLAPVIDSDCETWTLSAMRSRKRNDFRRFRDAAALVGSDVRLTWLVNQLRMAVMARTSNTDERRSQIVDGLQVVMATHGYERATVAEIAKAASLTPGLVHYHFETKQEILLALIERLAGVWRARAARRQEIDAEPRERLGLLLDAWLGLDERADAAAVACWVTLSGEALRQPAVRELYVGALREAKGALEHAVREVLVGESRAASEATAIAAALIAAIQGYLQLGVLAAGLVPRASAARTLRAMANGAIEAQPMAAARGTKRGKR
jgi:TetR/AcrR family transcriptional repressor of bet genes